VSQVQGVHHRSRVRIIGHVFSWDGIVKALRSVSSTHLLTKITDLDKQIMPPRGSEGLDFTPILTHYLFLFTTILAVVCIKLDSHVSIFILSASQYSWHGSSRLSPNVS
jgi:hypothetical protein